MRRGGCRSGWQEEVRDRKRGLLPASARRPVRRFRRSAAVLAFWRRGELVLENYATRISVAAEPAATGVLGFCDGWRTMDEIVASFDQYDSVSLRALVNDLVAHTLLVRSDAAADTRERAMAAWGNWNPAAGFFHTSTKNIRYPHTPAESDRRSRSKARTAPPPPPTKRYPRRPTVALPAARRDGELPTVLRRRRTWREFARTPVHARGSRDAPRPDLGRAAHARPSRARARSSFKTSPSGGVAASDRGLRHGAARARARARAVSLRRRAAIVSRGFRPGATPAPWPRRFLGGQSWFARRRRRRVHDRRLQPRAVAVFRRRAPTAPSSSTPATSVRRSACSRRGSTSRRSARWRSTTDAIEPRSGSTGSASRCCTPPASARSGRARHQDRGRRPSRSGA